MMPSTSLPPKLKHNDDVKHSRILTVWNSLFRYQLLQKIYITLSLFHDQNVKTQI